MQHTGMLWLPAALEAAGVNVWVVDGWDTAQGNYLWTDPDTETGSYDGTPSVFMVHHTAGTAATPVVKAGDRWSKANCWIGLRRGDRLYQTGGGTPTIAITSAGPARVSSGFGVRATFDQVRSDSRFHGPQQAADDGWAANRYAWNAEVVHPGDGSPLDAGVRDAVVTLGAVLCERFGWSPWRVYGHLDHTRRKIDPYWDGDRYAIADIQDDVAALLEVGTPPIEPELPPVTYDPLGRTISYIKQGQQGLDVEYWQVRAIEASTGIKFYGTSARAFIQTEAPQLTHKVWNQAMTDYLSAWTGRNSYGIGPSERVLIENTLMEMYS